MPIQRRQWVRRATPSLICVTLRPSPTSRIRFSSGISSPSKTSSQWPPCSSGPMIGMRRSMRQPGSSASKRNAVSPLRASSDVLAMRIKCRAPSAPVMNHLRPLTTHLAPFFSAVVSIAEGSEPEPGMGSVMTKAERIRPSTMGLSQRSLPFSSRVFSRAIMLPSSGAAQLKARGPNGERAISS